MNEDRPHLRVVDPSPPPNPPSIGMDLRIGGGGPYDPGMEVRVAALEAHMENLRGIASETKSAVSALDGRVREVETTLATLTERVAHLPSKGFIVTVVLLSLALIAAMIGFSDQLQTLFGQTPSP